MSRASLTPFVLCLLIACDPGVAGPTRDTGGGADSGMDGRVSGCMGVDADGDGIDDAFEDTDDPDHDGDGYLDSEEAGDNPCAPPDSDGDGTPDFRDTDSDNDGLPDARERELGTNPRLADTDGDGVTDLGEVDGTGTDPLDDTDTIDPADFFVLLPHLGDRQERRLQFGTNINQADVFFLVDMTGSMQGERTNLIRGLLDTIIPGIEAAIDDVHFGAGGFDDYPIPNFGHPDGSLFGGSGAGDLPFYLLRDIAPAEEDLGAWTLSATETVCPLNAATEDIGMIAGGANGTADILEAVRGLPCHFGNDGPESYVPALYSTASGLGLSWTGGSVPDRTCPVVLDETGVRRGYPCFRPGSLPIILMFGDAPFHNGPGGSQAYSFPAPTYDQAVTELNGIGARVLGIFSGGAASPDFQQVALDTGTVDGTGAPLFFSISGTGDGLDSTVVDAVASLVGGTPQDVSTRTENVDGVNPDNFDATLFIKSITPVEGYRDGIPGTGYSSFDATTFYDVIPGTIVEFSIDFYNDVRPPAAVAQIFQARIIVVGNGVADLDDHIAYILVPPDGESILI